MLKDYETFWMIYILVISALGNLLNQTLPAGILGYRNENNRTRASAADYLYNSKYR